jgi:RNA polymerase sigma factor (sigma-70 family)
MPTSPLNVVIQHLMADLGPDGDRLTDAELLAHFLRSRDRDALAALVRRHARMVWGVCCRLLSRHQDAEDAFQAAFLVLVRKAAAVPRQAVANWLYGVARQTALRLRATAAKRGRRETQVVTMPEPTVAERPDADLSSVLDEELGRLPEHYRGVVVLCDLEDMTRKEAARQLGIPEGSVASRLARARLLLAKRLTRRGFALSGGSVAGVLSAGSASVAAPPALVASTIRAANLLAAGRATGIVTARAAVLAEGAVKAMFVSKIKGVSAVVLVAAAVVGAAGVYYRAPAAEPPTAKAEPRAAKDDQTLSEVRQIAANPPAQPKQQPAKTDLERMAGMWTIVNGDRQWRDDGLGAKGQVWEIGTHQIVPDPFLTGIRTRQYFHRLDSAKTPKQIDITVTAATNKIGTELPLHKDARILGVIKGIYELDRGELRLCLGEMGKDRPAAFPEKPKQGEVLILHGGPEWKEEQGEPADHERIDGNWIIVNDDGNRKGEFWVFDKDRMLMDAKSTGLRARQYSHRLDASKTPKHIDITVTNVSGPSIGTIKGIYSLDGDELRLCLAPMNKDRPAAFPDKPGPGEVLILHRTPPTMTKEEKLRVLIDQVLAAHGGEDKLNKLTSFTMTVKHSNGETQHYFVQPPKNFRWETTHLDRTGKRIVILFPQGRRWWTKEPNADPKEFIPTGAELKMEYWLDHVKFFGPRQVLRLKDADHKVALLDEEAKIGERAAVGVEVTGPQFHRKMYFDKETHLLLKSGAVTYSDYKKLDGIPIAQREHDGHFEPVVTDFRAVDKLDAKLFEQP